ncbi:10182_t:CDS:1, partial [Ambispora leptoticha]
HLLERCTWDLKFTVTNFANYNMIVVSNGVCVEESSVEAPIDSSSDEKITKNIFKYKLDVPTSAHHIGFAAGPFERIVFEYGGNEKNYPEISGYCLPRRSAVLKSTFGLDTADRWSFLNEAMKFFMDEYQNFHNHFPNLTEPQLLKSPGFFPYPSYKLVFVENTFAPVTSIASMSICSFDLLHPIDIIDQVYDTRMRMVQALATQWFGIFILPLFMSDVWLTLSLANYFALLFLTKLFGKNDLKYRIKKDMERVCQMDVGRPPLVDRNIGNQLDNKDVDFMRVKGTLVLYMLDIRIRRCAYYPGIPGVIASILRASQNNRLKYNLVSTRIFTDECTAAVPERVDMIKRFFQQWIYSSGCPKFDIKYNFNRKKMMVEFQISQQNTNAIDGKIGDAFACGIKPMPVFTGPMIVCVHEADGKSYEHMLNIQGSNEKHQVPYHTKYKRIRRNTKRFKEKQAAAKEEMKASSAGSVMWGYKISDSEKYEWEFTAWGEEVDDEKGNSTGETFEWIRVNEDNGWLCEMQFNQPDYMWATQLQKDIDVLAQYEAVQMLGNMPSREASSTLLQTLLDERYYCKVRMEAAYAMAKCVGRTGRADLGSIGFNQLVKTFKKLYCITNGEKYVPDANNFSNINDYFVKKGIVWAISNVKHHQAEIVEFIMKLLQYNDNTGNEFSDNYYVATLINALGNAFTSDKPNPNDNKTEYISEDISDSLEEALQELERYRYRDMMFPTYRNTTTVAYIDTKHKLMKNLFNELLPEDKNLFLIFSLYGHHPDVRLAAFRAIISLDQWKTKSAVNYLKEVAMTDPSLTIRRQLQQIMTGKDLGPPCWIPSYKDVNDNARPLQQAEVKQQSTELRRVQKSEPMEFENVVAEKKRKYEGVDRIENKKSKKQTSTVDSQIQPEASISKTNKSSSGKSSKKKGGKKKEAVVQEVQPVVQNPPAPIEQPAQTSETPQLPQRTLLILKMKK